MSEQADRVAEAYARSNEASVAQFLECLPFFANVEAELRDLVAMFENRARQLECERAARSEPTQWHDGAPYGAEGLYLVDVVPDWVPHGWTGDATLAGWTGGELLVRWYGHKGYCRVTDSLVYDHQILRHRWLSE